MLRAYLRTRSSGSEPPFGCSTGFGLFLAGILGAIVGSEYGKDHFVSASNAPSGSNSGKDKQTIQLIANTTTSPLLLAVPNTVWISDNGIDRQAVGPQQTVESRYGDL